MKTTLKDTIRLSESGVITDNVIIHNITQELINIPLADLENVSKCFSFVRNTSFIGQEEHDDFFADFTFFNILDVPDQYRDDGEDEIRCQYLRDIMMGLLEATSIQQVRLFHSVSLSQYLYIHKNINYKTFADMAKLYLNLNITNKTSMKDFFLALKNRFYENWNLRDDIKIMRRNILGCGELLDIALIHTIFCK